MLITTIGYLLLTAYYSRVLVYREIERQVGFANEVASNTEAYFLTVSNQAVFMGALPSVNRVLSQPTLDTESYRSMAGDLSVYSVDSTYDSVYLINDVHERIYVSNTGMYNYYDFYDRSILSVNPRLEGLRVDNEYWLFNRQIKRHFNQSNPIDVITLVRQLPLNEVSSKGLLVINLNKQSIWQSIGSFPGVTNARVKVLWGDEVLYNSIDEASSFSLTLKQSKDSNFTVYTEVPYLSLLNLLSPMYIQIALFYLLTLCLALFASYIYSRRQLEPLDSLIHRLGFVSANTSNSKVSDEHDYGELAEAIDLASLHIKNMTTEVQVNRPIIREKLLSDLLISATTLDDRRAELESYDIYFPYPYFAIVLIDIFEIEHIHNYSIREELKLIVRETSLDQLSKLGYAYAALIDKDQILITLNTKTQEGLDKRLASTSDSIAKALLTNLDANLRFSVVLTDDEDQQNLHTAFQLARRNFLFTSIDPGGSIHITSTQDQADSIDLEPYAEALVSSITAKQSARTKSLLTEVFDTFKSNSLEEVKTLSFELLTAVSTELFKLNLTLDLRFLSLSFSQIQLETDKQALFNIVHTFLDDALLLATTEDADSEYYVSASIEFIMKEATNSELTIPDIAKHVSLNSVYLGRLFKLATGQTLSEYLNRYRIELSINLLTELDLSINDISEKVGYTDVRSFIRFFKKYKGSTPGKFRENL